MEDTVRLVVFTLMSGVVEKARSPPLLEIQQQGDGSTPGQRKQKHTAESKRGREEREERGTQSGWERGGEHQEKNRCSDPDEGKRRPEDNRCLLEELSVIEAELRESLRMEEEREREGEFLRQQSNRTQQQHLMYLKLNQRINKPWVTSYFRKFPMHIYCLPIQNTALPTRRATGTTRR